MSSTATDRRDVEPPPGITVARSSELDRLCGSSDRWAYRGEVNGVAIYGCGLPSRRAACRKAWAQWSMARRDRGDHFDDLAEAIERGAVDGDGSLESEGRYTVALGSWESMVGALFSQVAAESGGPRAVLGEFIRDAPGVARAWRRGVGEGMDALASWLEGARPDASTRPVLAPSVRARRGDDYLDLCEAVGGFALAGDGALDPVGPRTHYTVERGPWLRMVGDLLGQAVGDAGSVEHAATVLAVTPARLTRWVRWIVSRGSLDAARSRWPVEPGDTLASAIYLEFIEAIERGAVDGDNSIDAPMMDSHYCVALDSWARMRAELLGQLVADAGSIRRAAVVLDVPRATLGAWHRQGRAALDRGRT